MKHWFKWILLLFVAIIPLAGIYLFNNPVLVTEMFTDTGGFSKGERLPLVKAEEVLGGTVDMQQYKGKPFVAMMAKIDCETCKSSYPMLQKWTQLYPEVPLVMLGVGSKDEYAKVKNKLNFPFPLLLADEAMQAEYRMKITPVFYFVDENQTIVERMNGFRIKEFESLMESVKR
ncbi:MAG: TlpA family protein disulfide reductase [Clostridia bacterium]